MLLVVGLMFTLGGGSRFSISSYSMSLGDVGGNVSICSGESLLAEIDST